MTRLLSLVLGLTAAALVVNGFAQSREAQKADNDPFKYAVYTGRIACESNVFVSVIADKKNSHHFDVSIGKLHYKTERVATDSGAIRLEDKTHGIVWLQMSNKSMLLDEKEGKRLANNCRNAAQTAVEKTLSKSTSPTLLDTPTPKSP
jgi:hypothetical protein